MKREVKIPTGDRFQPLAMAISARDKASTPTYPPFRPVMSRTPDRAPRISAVAGFLPRLKSQMEIPSITISATKISIPCKEKSGSPRLWSATVSFRFRRISRPQLRDRYSRKGHSWNRTMPAAKRTAPDRDKIRIMLFRVNRCE